MHCSYRKILQGDDNCYVRESNGSHLQNASKNKSMQEISVVANLSRGMTQKLFLVFVVLLFTSSLAGHILKSWSPPVLALILIGCLAMYLHFMLISQETLLLISSLGVQISSVYFTGRRVTKFIPFGAVQDIIIHEAVTMHKVVYYLAVLLRHQQDGRWSNSLVPVFVHSMPRLSTLREIHSSVHRMLDSEKLQTET